MKAKLKLIFIFLKVRLYTLFKKQLNVTFDYINGQYYCRIPGWPEEYFNNTVMVGDAHSLIHSFNTIKAASITFHVYFSNTSKPKNDCELLILKHSSITGGGYYIHSPRFSNVWLCPVTLFVLGKFPMYIYFQPIDD